MNPLPAAKALDAYFLDARCRLLDLAAMLDRLQRGSAESAPAETDPRVRKIQQALAILLEPRPDKAEAIQQLFSLEYDPNWVRPSPR